VSRDPARAALATAVVDGQAAAQNVFVLHGIYGRGRNWAAVARRLVTRRPDWRPVLVDLRGHGDSPVLPAPHTVAESARDVAGLAATRGLPLHAVIGHSFGGKVALSLAAPAPPDLRQVWVVDSTPAPKAPEGTAWRMLDVARRHPGPFTSRQEGAARLQESGIDADVAAWMVSNLTRRAGTRAPTTGSTSDATHGHYVWRLDFDVMEALLRDFFSRDLWHVIESPPQDVTVHVVKATRSSIVSDDACRRLEDAGRRHGRVFLHRLEGGHWINSDNPEALSTLIAEHLPRADPLG
jgi:pimeloyl-ACP methyl ester carboxylesterase